MSGKSKNIVYKNLIKNIPPYNYRKNEKDVILKTKIPIDKIEGLIVTVLDKHCEKCKYYIDIENAYFGVSFNVGMDQLDAMNDTMFYIYIYMNENIGSKKESDNMAMIKMVNDSTNHPEWKDIKKELITLFHYVS